MKTRNLNNGWIQNLRGAGRATTEAITHTDTLLGAIAARNGRVQIVLNGGTSSQRNEFDHLWTDAVLNAWAAVKAKHGMKVLWRINFNSTAEIQRDLIARVNAIVGIDALILGGEFWLNKYHANYPDGKFPAGVGPFTQGYSISKYLMDCAFWRSQFAQYNVPFVIMAAPEKGGARMRQWNDTLAANLPTNYIIGLHTYPRGNNALWNVPASLQRLQTLFPSSPIWILEGGMADDGEGGDNTAPLEQIAADEAKLFTDIDKVLRPIDIGGDHCAYKPAQPATVGNLGQGWITNEGFTVKGQVLLDALYPVAPATPEPAPTPTPVEPTPTPLPATGIHITLAKPIKVNRK